MKLRGTTRWVIYALVVWLGGLGCLAGCFAQTSAAAAAHAEHVQVAQEESDCSDGCCKKKKKDTGSESDPQPVQKMDCCIYLTTPPATLAKKAVGAAPRAFPVETTFSQALPGFHAFAVAPDSPLLDSSGTYLRLRVLRI